MAKLDKEFKTFYNDEVKFDGDAEIREKKNKLKDDFSSNFPKLFKDKYNVDFSSSRIRFIDQGSYKIGTTIKFSDKAYDIDIAAIIELDTEKYKNPIEIKKIVEEALTHTNRVPEVKEPCITVKYTTKGEEKYHIDFPVYANKEGDLLLARGKKNSNEENRKWEIADPEGLNYYFLNDHLQLEGLDLNDDKKKERKQKKRIIRYLKWWKAMEYINSENGNEVPPSIALTLLTCSFYKKGIVDGAFNDLLSLYNTTDKILSEIFYEGMREDKTKGMVLKACLLPVEPKTDVFYKLRNSNKHIDKFYSKLKNLRDKLNEAYLEKSERKAGEIIEKLFGESFPLPEEDKVNKSDSFA